MKKVIAIVLAVVLVAGGLGGFAYALDTVNEVHVSFQTIYGYTTLGDDFTNTEVTGHKQWNSGLRNTEDTTGLAVADTTLTLADAPQFDWVQPETPGPPYEWSFGDVLEGWWFAKNVSLGFHEDLVSFTPGFNASRSVDKTEFLESGTQTLTITVTPQQLLLDLNIGVRVSEDAYVIPTIILPITGDTGEASEIHLSDDGHELFIGIHEPQEGSYTYNVTIQVLLKEGISKVDFMPWVSTHSNIEVTSGSATDDSSITHSMSGVGTWTWSATGNYDFDWHEIEVGHVRFESYSRGIVEPIPHEPMTGQKLVGMGYLGEHYDEESDITFQLHTMFSFTNPDGVSEITIDRVSIFAFDGTVLYEGPLKPGTEERIMMPHEVDAVELHDYLEPADLIPVTVEIFWSWTDKEGLPLIGWQLTTIGIQDAEGNPIEMTSSESQMVNMEQVLEPAKEKKEK